MRTVRFSDLIQSSIDRTKLILFRPFQIRKWLTLVFIAMLAGALNSGGRANLGNRNQNAKPQEKQETQKLDLRKKTSPETPLQTQSQSQTQPETQSQANPQAASSFSKLSPGIIVALVLLGLVISVFFMWLSSRFEFIWTHAVIRNVSQIVEPWRIYRPQGQSLFRVRLAVMAGSLLYLGAIALWGFVVLRGAGAFEKDYVWSFSGTVALLAPLLFIVIPVSLVAGFLLSCIGNFAVPLMLRDQNNFVSAWKKFWPLFQANLGDFILFALINFLLKILSALLEIVGMLGVLLAYLIVGVIVFGPLYFIFVSLLKLNTVMVLVGIILGIPFLVALFLSVLFVRLPFAVFFRSLTLDYLSSHGGEYGVFSLS